MAIQPVDPPVEDAPVSDIRSIRPHIFRSRPLQTLSRRLTSVVALIALDLAGISLALYLALTVRELTVGHRPPLWGILWQAETNWMPFVGLIAVLVFWRNGLYASRELRAGAGRIVSSLAVVTVLTFVFSVGTGHDFTTFAIFPVTLVLACLLVGLFRASYDLVTRDVFRVAGVRRRVALVGEEDGRDDLRRMLGSSRGGIEYAFVGEVAPSAREVAELLGRERVDELVVAYTELDDHALTELVEVAHRYGVKVRVAPRTTELIVERAEYVPGQGVPLFELRPAVFEGADWAIKRGFDLAVSVLVVVLGLPIWLAIAGAIKLSSSGPVFYRDRRIGLQEQPFAMLKFRTMYADAHERQAALEPENEAPGALFKIRDDPRVTRVGALLRRFSLDEVPQVLNVLRSEMSLVGPRPLPVRDYVLLEEWHRRRYLVLPGMSGLWQVSGRSNLPFDDLVRLDFYYLENWSIWLDITILLKTLPAVLASRGAY